MSDTYTPQVNGVTTVVHRIVSLLRGHGHDVSIVVPRYPNGSSSLDPHELRIPSAPFPLYPDIRLALPPFRRIGRFFDASPPEVVHVHTEGPLGLAGRRWALSHRVPLVTSYHTNFPEYSRHYGVGFLEPLVWSWLRWFHGPARATFTPGEAIRDELISRGLKQTVVWGRGVDPHFFHPGRRDGSWRRWLAGGDDTAVVLHVGRLAHEKNLGVLIEAWRRARATLGQRATFVIAGEGPEARRLQAELPFVRMLGFLPRADLATLYASADLCVFPSHTETCGLVALEAMASGIAVIAADAGGFRESIGRGTNGLLVPAHEPAAYAAAIEALVNDPAARFALAAAARDRALGRDVVHENAELLDRYAELSGLAERRALASTAGVRKLVARGSRARETVAAAERLLADPDERMLFVYLPDCDRAGHAHGWMSPQYLEAAAEVDAGVGQLSRWTDDVVFMVTADHGGGGVTATEHDEPHPVNDHIPLILAGPGVTRRHQLTRTISLLDVPATVLWWFGVPVPICYEGRPMSEAFFRVAGPAPEPVVA